MCWSVNHVKNNTTKYCLKTYLDFFFSKFLLVILWEWKESSSNSEWRFTLKNQLNSRFYYLQKIYYIIKIVTYQVASVQTRDITNQYTQRCINWIIENFDLQVELAPTSLNVYSGVLSSYTTVNLTYSVEIVDYVVLVWVLPVNRSLFLSNFNFSML